MQPEIYEQLIRNKNSEITLTGNYSDLEDVISDSENGAYKYAVVGSESEEELLEAARKLKRASPKTAIVAVLPLHPTDRSEFFKKALPAGIYSAYYTEFESGYIYDCKELYSNLISLKGHFGDFPILGRREEKEEQETEIENEPSKEEFIADTLNTNDFQSHNISFLSDSVGTVASGFTTVAIVLLAVVIIIAVIAEGPTVVMEAIVKIIRGIFKNIDELANVFRTVKKI